MATNYVGAGDLVTVAAPHNVVAGRVVVVGVQLYGVALANADSGANVALARGGVWTFAKPNATSTSAAAGAIAYWDNTNSTVGISATSNTKIGVYLAAVGNTDTTATVALNPNAL
jgi:predicted RecA/RadA family phage recombinase